jgi:hypothetical protein
VPNLNHFNDRVRRRDVLALDNGALCHRPAWTDDQVIYSDWCCYDQPVPPKARYSCNGVVEQAMASIHHQARLAISKSWELARSIDNNRAILIFASQWAESAFLRQFALAYITVDSLTTKHTDATALMLVALASVACNMRHGGEAIAPSRCFPTEVFMTAASV